MCFLPNATVSSHAACNTDFIDTGAWEYATRKKMLFINKIKKNLNYKKKILHERPLTEYITETFAKFKNLVI